MKGVLWFARVSLAVVAGLFSPGASAAEVGLAVDESQTLLHLRENGTAVSIALINSGSEGIAAIVDLEVLDPGDAVRAKAERELTIAPGHMAAAIELTPSLLALDARDATDLLLYRLRYRVTPSGAQRPRPSIEGTLALSQIAPEVFELHAVGPEYVRPGRALRVNVRAGRGAVAAAGVNVEAKLDMGEGQQLSTSTTTGRDGLAVLQFQLPVNVTGEEGELKLVAKRDGLVARASSSITLDRHVRILISTDKPLYQPGQTLHVRSVAFDARRQAIAGAEGFVSVRDEDGQRLFTSKVTTNRFGVASADWAIPTDARLGAYAVEAGLAEETWGEASSNTQTIAIRRYELPTFAVNAKLDRPFYLPGQSAVVEVRSDYLFGRPVKGAHVRVVRQLQREWNYREQRWEVEEESAGEGTADGQGRFTAAIALAQDHEQLAKDEQRTRDLDLAAYVDDPSTGRTEQRRFSLRLSREPLHVYFIRPNFGIPTHGPFDFYVSTFSADGHAVSCDVAIRVDGRLARQVKTNAYGVAKVDGFALPPLEQAGKIELKFEARDAQGRTGHADESEWLDDDLASLQVDPGKTIHRPREPINVQVRAGKGVEALLVEVMRESEVLSSTVVALQHGVGSTVFPYDPAFRGALTVQAYPVGIARAWQDGASRPVLYPARDDLKLLLTPAQRTYRPGGEATLRVGVSHHDGRPAEGAVGLVVLDEALEERARTDEEFGSAWGFFSGFVDPEQSESMGAVTREALERLDLSKPIPEGLDLVAEILFASSAYPTGYFDSDHYTTDPRRAFGKRITEQLKPIETALRARYHEGEPPASKDEALGAIAAAGALFVSLRDPWDVPYLFELGPDGTVLRARVMSAGPDKRPGTADDFPALVVSWKYFEKTGHQIDEAVAEYHRRTGTFIRDESILRAELTARGLEVDGLRDPWGRRYAFEFGIEREWFTITIRSPGPDGVFGGKGPADDVDVWRSATDYFADTRERVRSALAKHFDERHAWPLQREEFDEALRADRLDQGVLLDPWGTPYDVTFENKTQFSDRVEIQAYGTYPKEPVRKTSIRPVTQSMQVVQLISLGPDRKRGTGDDFQVADYWHVLLERTAEGAAISPAPGSATGAGATGSIRGRIVDDSGAALPGATVSAVHSGVVARTTTTGSDGTYSLDALPLGTYGVRVSLVGFRSTWIEGVPVGNRDATALDIHLAVAAQTESVTVSGESIALATRSSSVAAKVASPSLTAAAAQIATPRVRQYFPETLLWRPDLETDASGGVVLRFRLADSITTWRVRALASTVDGRIGTADTEILAFQPFFVEHDPPSVLTQGDEIELPVVVRNYLRESLAVDLSLQDEPWFLQSAGGRHTVRVEGSGSAREVFGFQARDTVAAGRQRVTAISRAASDAVEKTVKVHPDGQEVVRTTAQMVGESPSLEVAVPAEAMPGTIHAQLRLYPSLMAHVTESVEAILQRPYGCAEQILSSSYPSLLVLSYPRPPGGQSSAIALKARRYLQLGYDRLVGDQLGDGGFSYWGRGVSDVALTAYALRFLHQADRLIVVDPNVTRRATAWLLKQQREDGAWVAREWSGADSQRLITSLTAYVAHAIARVEPAAATRSLAYLHQHVAELDEPYAIGLYALLARGVGDDAHADAAGERLRALAHTEVDATYWHLDTNTVFHGWGLAGRIEATAVAVQALATSGDPGARELGRRGLLYLLRNKDRYGVWHSTQATALVLDALMSQMPHEAASMQSQAAIDVIVNGQAVGTFPLSDDVGVPVSLDLSQHLVPGANRLELRGAVGKDALARVVATYFLPWSSQPPAAGGPLSLKVAYDATSTTVGTPVTCHVIAERVGFRGFGMLLAEIGLPPGAEVDRASLERALSDSDSGMDAFDVLPDRVVAYLWPRAGGSHFSFTLRPRFAMKAAAAASTVYDYYNPEAMVTLAPARFVVR